MSSTIILACLGLLVASGVCCVFMVPLVRRLALAVNLVDRPGERKIHDHVIPYGGGIAIFFSFIIIIVAAYLLLISDFEFFFLGEVRRTLEPHMAGLLAEKTIWRLAAMLAGGGAIFLLGLIDDHYGCGAYSKLTVQVLMAVLLWYSGTRITLFIGHWTVSLMLTVFWMVLITNAMNLLDNMDGLSSGVGAIAAAIFLVVAVQAGQIFVASLMAVLIGSLLGFLWFNFNPASIFMGDAGSLFLGYMLGAISISSTYYQESESGLAVVIPLVVLAIPLFDTASVMLIRWRTGKPFMQGDKNHFSHRLVRLGMTPREAVLTIYILTASLGLTAMLLQRLDRWGGALVLLHTVGILVVVGLLEHAAHRRRS